MAWVVGETVSEIFSTGVAGETFTRVASYIDGAATVWNPTFTDLGSGFYRYAYTPSAAGSHEWAGTGSASGALAINFDVVTAAQADPAAAFLSGTIRLVSPVLGNGSARVVRGDDYLTAIGRALTWTIEDQTLPGDAALAFILYGLDGTVALTKPMTVVDAGPPDALVSVDLTHAETAALGKASLPCAIVMTRDTDKVVTLWRGTVTVETTPP